MHIRSSRLIEWRILTFETFKKHIGAQSRCADEERDQSMWSQKLRSDMRFDCIISAYQNNTVANSTIQKLQLDNKQMFLLTYVSERDELMSV